MRTPISSRSIARPDFAVAVAALLAVCGTANADPAFTLYSTAAGFNGAAPGTTTYDFPSGGGDDGVQEARPYIVGPLGFSTLQRNETHPFLYDDGGYGTGLPYLAFEGPPGEGVNAAIQPVVDGDLYAVSFDIGTYAGADTIEVSINRGATDETFQTTSGVGSSTFIGIVSSTPIWQISLTAQDGNEIDILDFQVGPITAPVPEPASVSMALAGLGLLGFAARRRKGAKA